MKKSYLTVVLLLIVILGNVKFLSAQTTLPGYSSKLPSTLQIGTVDSPGGAATLRQGAPFQYRYQYLAGGVNTGTGWATWNTNGAFATNYIQESIQAEIIPVFTYYMIYQSRPGGGTETAAITTNLRNTSTMQAYFADLKLFFQKAAQFPNNAVILHVEPDMWGYIQQNSTNDNATTFAVQVGATNIADVTQFPNNAAGLAQAIIKLRDIYAPNVILAYHLSLWGTGTSPIYSNLTDNEVINLAHRSSAFYISLNANFDLYFSEFRDRDAAFYQYQYGDPNAWWDENDFHKGILYMKTMTQDIQKRNMIWQIPLGNTKMKAMNNTWNHYQDNIVENLFEDTSRVKLTQFRDAGVIGLLFGRGADGATCACDASHDGVTNPNPINNNTTASYSADDDGGYFKVKINAYYQTGPLSLSGGLTPTPSLTPLPTGQPTATRVPTSTITITQIPSITPSVSVSPSPTISGCDKTHGDANCDGLYNLVDFEIWRKEFMGILSTKTADFNADGNVTILDFESWRKKAMP